MVPIWHSLRLPSPPRQSLRGANTRAARRTLLTPLTPLSPQNGQPRPENSPGRGCRCAKQFGKRTCKPNSVVCGHSSRRRVAADAHQRPTRRFRRPADGSLLRGGSSVGLSEQPCGAGPAPDALPALGARLPPYLVLLRVGFTLPPALPPERCALTAPFHPYPGAGVVATASGPGKPGQLGYCVSRAALRPDPKKRGGVAEAVCFLWHWPSTSLYAHVPDVIRHTALRSSDFPPPAEPVSQPTGSDRPVLLPVVSVSRIRNGQSTFVLCQDSFGGGKKTHASPDGAYRGLYFHRFRGLAAKPVQGQIDTQVPHAGHRCAKSAPQTTRSWAEIRLG